MEKKKKGSYHYTKQKQKSYTHTQKKRTKQQDNQNKETSKENSKQCSTVQHHGTEYNAKYSTYFLFQEFCLNVSIKQLKTLITA